VQIILLCRIEWKKIVDWLWLCVVNWIYRLLGYSPALFQLPGLYSTEWYTKITMNEGKNLYERGRGQFEGPVVRWERVKNTTKILNIDGNPHEIKTEPKSRTFRLTWWIGCMEETAWFIWREYFHLIQPFPANRRFDPSTLPQHVQIPKRSSFPGKSMIANARAHWRCLQAQSRRPAILVVW
jgi:hypothetical protein